MFNIIETLRNYFTRKLLHDNLCSEVALHFNIIYWRPYLVINCSEEVLCQPMLSLCPLATSYCHIISDSFSHNSYIPWYQYTWWADDTWLCKL